MPRSFVISAPLVGGGLLAALLSGCAGEPVETVSESARQYVATYVGREHPLVRTLVVDDRDRARVDALLRPEDHVLEDALVTLATSFEDAPGPRVEAHPREVAIVVVLPASGRIVGPNEIRDLHLHAPDFDGATSARMAAAIRAAVALAAPAPSAPYAPFEAAADAERLVMGRRPARSPSEAALEATVRAAARKDHTVSVLTWGGDERAHAGAAPLVCDGTGAGCDPLVPHALFPFGVISVALSVPRAALDPIGEASCVVEVRGRSLGCEARGWTRSATRPNAEELCFVPQLRGEAGAACRERVACTSCDPGFCARSSPVPHIAFTKNASPFSIDATMRVVCNY